MKAILRLLHDVMQCCAICGKEIEQIILISANASWKRIIFDLMVRTRLNFARKILFFVPFMTYLNFVFAAPPCIAKDEERNSGMVSYSSPTQKYSYSLPGYYVSNNAWGVKNLSDGVDYWTSVTFDPTNFQSGTSFSWRYPQNVGRVYGYPHIDYDPQAAGVSSTQAANIVSLSASFNVDLSDTANSTVAFDIWFNSQPDGPWETTSVELLVEVHPTSRPFTQYSVLQRLSRLFRAQPAAKSASLPDG